MGPNSPVMPYVTHPIRRVRDDPVEDETIDLLVRVEDEGADQDATADVDAVAEVLRELGAEGVDDRGLGALTARVPQAAVGEICELDALASVETTDSLTIHPDGAGEDVEY